MKPNIFDIATKELHQDAFIAWLLKWAEPENSEFDKKLHSCAQEFIRLLILTQQQNIPEILKVDSGRQWNNIDVWAEVYTAEKNFLIIIEDKTFTSEHSDQLLKYKKIGEDYCVENDLQLICIYFKTGSEPEKDLKAIRLKGFSTFSRSNLLELAAGYMDISNNIFRDFIERLERLDAAYNAFEHTTINHWDDLCWIGFYQLLEKEMDIVGWEYVNRPGGGGFWNALLNWEDWEGFPVYLQIEQGKLCFKVATHPDVISYEEEFNRSEIRNEWYEVLMTEAQKVGMTDLKKPDRFGSGNYMTCAVIDKDIWLGSDATLINKEQVIERLKKYKEFLKNCLKDY